MWSQEIVRPFAELPSWYTHWLVQHHGDGLHQHVRQQGVQPGERGDQFLQECEHYLRLQGLDAWIQDHRMWMRVDLSDPQWLWYALKSAEDA